MTHAPLAWPGDVDSCDVLIAGAGPTGLTLAAELARFGISVLLVDSSLDRTHESRALAVQPRSLEVLHRLGVAPELIERGKPAVRLRITAGGRETHTRLAAGRPREQQPRE